MRAIFAAAVFCAAAAVVDADADFTYRKVNVGAINLNVGLMGPSLAVNKVLLLHGFPEGSHMWALLTEALHEQLESPETYQFIMPDLRGYNASDKPEDVSQYHVHYLVQDCANLLRRLSPSTRVHVIGHDWGAIVGWSLAATHPQMLRSLQVINAGHPRGWAEAIRQGQLQSVMSQYILMFLSDAFFSSMFNNPRHQAAVSKAKADPNGSDAAEREMLISVMKEMLANSYVNPKTGLRAGKKSKKGEPLPYFWDLDGAGAEDMARATAASWALDSIKHGLKYYRANFQTQAPKDCWKSNCFTKYKFTSSFDNMPPLVDVRTLVLWGDVDATFLSKDQLKYIKRSVNTPMGLEVKRFRDGTHWVTYEPHQQIKMAKAIAKFWAAEQDVEHGGKPLRVTPQMPVQGDWLMNAPDEMVAHEDQEDGMRTAELSESAGRGTSPAAEESDTRDEL